MEKPDDAAHAAEMLQKYVFSAMFRQLAAAVI